MSSRNLGIVAVVAVIIFLGWWLVKSQSQTATPAPYNSSGQVPTEAAAPTSAASPSGAMSENVVTISSSGFSPKDITIKAGESVTWMNNDSAVHTVNSAVHPTHQLYPPLNLGNIQAGGKVSLAFPGAGTYKYHDHLNPSSTGSVTVQ